MPIVTIGSSNYKVELKKRFEIEAKILKKDNLIIRIEYINQENNLFIKLITEDNSLKFEILKEFIANVLSDIIINNLEVDFIYKIVNINCKSLNQNEKEKIVDIALNRLNLINDKEIINAKVKRKNRILLEIINYIEEDKEIILEGFVRFRLKKYLAELETAVTTAIEEYGIEKECKGFVHLLKYYIDSQLEDNKLVNVIKIKNNGFKLLDNKQNIIETPFLDEYVLDQLEQELECENLLISALITIAPQEIILHFNRPFELVENLKKVFKEKLSICLGCKYCKVNSYEDLNKK